MIYSITGELVYADPNMAAVNVNGIAFQCDISLNTFQHLGSNGSTVTLYTYMNFKQDGVDLLGFYDRSEVDAFKMLTGVSGVGPKAALAILSEMDPAKLTLAIAAGDYKAITRAKGVGPKAAQRIVLELKDKVAKGLEGGNASDTFVAAATATAAGNSNAADAVGALVMLGYSQSEAAIAVGKLDQTLSTEELIKQALKQLA
ncbi:MAG: Holliday junction branch migration protein RuvA [Acutalibacteraceae bacterium]|jgi:Holliday junction DNA helicase RuvA|nr:Holliday junction branch migration protein RuvA [Clostridia bacterium]MDO4406246.1 Holliday junction branch migration protein RuvA [Eubacteriales bacterium]MEE1188298.1 Holliday junction branch migration protein RuvA [Acutalibacteraceae bacterium]MBQ3051822.1 Holliday junction branch migration protein RuvA [Clostridia bacterium]MBQ5480349.1 Holliday junction branch migration protein RuvA [Clostridia bacterium]